MYFPGMIFEDALILYDIVKDKVILLHYNELFHIDLPVRKIQQFILNGHRFIRLYPDSTKQIEEGFYDRLYQGKMTLFVRRRKMIREERTGDEINQVIDEKDLFYIYKDNVYTQVKNMRGLLNLFSDKRQEIQQYLRKNGVKFKKQPEKALLMTVEYYDRSRK
jgi:hypothetical protein